MEDNKHTYLNNEDALLNYFDNKTYSLSSSEIVIVCAGHFMLIPSKEGEGVFPGIFQGVVSDKYRAAKNVIGLFPQYTWELGCKIVSNCNKNGRKSKLSLLVNDWQLVPKDTQRAPSEPNGYREDFYRGFNSLPEAYSNLLRDYSLNFEQDVYRTKKEDFYLREVGLRDRFRRKMKSMKKDIQIIDICGLSLDKQGNISIEREEEGPFELIKDSRANCSSGIAQMILDISNHLKGEHKHITFINLMPSGCNEPANAASATAINILGVEAPEIDVRMINVFFEVHGVINEEDFYNESYGSQVFASEYKSKNYK